MSDFKYPTDLTGWADRCMESDCLAYLDLKLSNQENRGAEPGRDGNLLPEVAINDASAC